MMDCHNDFLEGPSPSSNRKIFGIENYNPIILPLLPSPLRLWRPAAQRNIRNQWSKLLSSKDHWTSATLEGRLHATELVNAYLRRRYLPEMNLGVLKDMPGIREKAFDKLVHKQDLFCRKLVSSYKDMVNAANDLGKASRSMRCYLKEDLACELFIMFIRELSLKRFLVIGLLSINDIKDGGKDALSWSNELYHGEFDDLTSTGMLEQSSSYPAPPQIKGFESSDSLNLTLIKSPSHNIFEAYLTTWISDLNINMHRVKEIFSTVEEEIHAKCS